MPGTGTRNAALRSNGYRLYTAGYQTTSGLIGTNTVVNIYDGTNWSTIGEISSTLGTMLIKDFAFLGNNVYVGGVFTHAGGVPAFGLAKWDGTNWSDVGAFGGLVFSLLTDGTNLYVGGSFTNGAGILMTNIAKWNGTNWSALGGGLGTYENTLAPGVYAMTWHNGELYAGGAFTNSGSLLITNLARWDGNAWSHVGGGVPGSYNFSAGPPISTLESHNGDLYVGGNFTTVGNSVFALNVAIWNGSTWTALGSGLKGSTSSSAPAPVTALAFLGSDLYATGNFTNSGGVTATRIAKWSGGSWSALGGLNDTGMRAISNSGSLYVCGVFNMASNVIGNHIIRWDGSAWHGLPGRGGQGTHFFVNALALGNDGLYMGGLFGAVAAVPASCIARWDGTNWNALGSGVRFGAIGTTRVSALKTWNNQILVGGIFTDAGGLTVSNIAGWNGSSWWTLGLGVDGSVGAIEAIGQNVYVAGSFTNIYNVSGFPVTQVRNFAVWNPSIGWDAMPMMIGNGSVSALHVHNGMLYAGGSFTNIGGVTVNRIAAWNGATWSQIGTGINNGSVLAILGDGTDLYVSGSFTNVNGIAVGGIAKWNGSSWSALGTGFVSSSTTPSIRALEKIGNYLYATGTFTNAGGVITRAIARWNGTNWEAMGSGIANDFSPGAGRGETLEAWGNDLFVGGIFETAGEIDSGYVARWNDQIDFTPFSTMRLSNPQRLPDGSFKFRVTATEYATYVIEHSGDFTNWTALATNSASLLDYTNSTAPNASFRVYRTREIP